MDAIKKWKCSSIYLQEGKEWAWSWETGPDVKQGNTINIHPICGGKNKIK